MLGIDLLQKTGVIWNFAECEIAFNQQMFPLLPSRKGGSYRCRRVVLAEDQVVPPRSQLDVNTKVIYDLIRPVKSSETEAWATESCEMEPGVLVARTVLPDRADNVPVRILNTTMLSSYSRAVT